LRPLLEGDDSALPAPPEVQAQLPRLKAELEQGLAEAERELGFRIDTEVDWAVVAFSNFQAREPSATVLVKGRFDRGKVIAAVSKSAAAEDHGGVTFYRRGKEAVAMLSDELLLIGNVDTMEATISRRSSGTRSLATNQTLMRLIDRVRTGSAVWGVGTEAFVGALRREIREIPFPLPSSVVASEHLGGGVEVFAEMSDPEAARSLAGVIEGGLAWLRSQGNGDAPREAPAPVVAADGRELRLTLRPPAGSKLPASLAFLAGAVAPALVRSMAAGNETTVIGEIRTIISAQAAFSAESGGFYGELRCLTEPKSCLPSSQASAAYLWDTGLALLYERSGYRRAFFPGPAGPQPALFQSFAYTASPSAPGQSGRRSFCGDSRGVVCAGPGDREIQASGGECPATCQPLP
jgi:hypothetical protein